jgi:polysaccharide export outer membrane protein
MYRSIFMLGGLVGLAGCDYIPRGAGLKSEILLEPQNRPEGAPPEFAVEVVTQQNLTTFVQWPSVDDTHLSWIDRVDQLDNRTIAAGDTLSITIWTSEENSLLTIEGLRSVTFPETRVSSSGTVLLPYFGDVRIPDMSPERARAH